MDYVNFNIINIIIAFNRGFHLFRFMLPIKDENHYRLCNRLIENISKNLLQPLKDKNITEHSFDSSSNYTALVDSLIYDSDSLCGIKLNFEQAYEIINRVETAMIEDLCEFIPNIDDSKLTIKNYNYLGNNAVLISIQFHYENSHHKL